MSNSKWKELPDWTKPEEYAFLDGAKPEVWAWEFLRRNPTYQQDWETFGSGKAGYHYCPPKNEAETEQQWMARVAYTNNLDPIKTPQGLYIARKWGLQNLYDPLLPHHQGMRFIQPGKEFPRMLSLPEQFLELIVDEEIDGGRVAIQHIGDPYAVLAFDITRALEAQIAAAKSILNSWKKKMKSAGRIKANGHSNKALVWVRHLRVLDARRSSPPAKHTAIGKVFGNEENAKSLEKQSETFHKQAQQMARTGYRYALLYEGTPLSKAPGNIMGESEGL